MDEEKDGRPIKVRVSDKRKAGRGGETSSPPPPPPPPAPENHEGPAGVEEVETVEEVQVTQPDYLEDLRRVQAEFDNYKKRMMREQTQMAERASAGLVERLLPVLDNFSSAVEHGEGGPGIELVYRELQKILAEEGLQEIESQGALFDPNVHEAFEAHEDEEVDEPVVAGVLRPGYSFKGRVLRPAMVSVARPREESSEEESEDAAEG